MYVVWGQSVKQQVVGTRSVSCATCREETSHLLVRHYAVKHIYYFPLFAAQMTYLKICERCALVSATDEPAIAKLVRLPFLHRMGFVFPVGALLLPLVFAIYSLMTGAGTAEAGNAVEAEILRSRGHFHSDEVDRAAGTAMQGVFESMQLEGPSVAARSARTNGHTLRLLTVQQSRLLQLSEDDRIRLFRRMEEIADARFPDDEVFLGLKSRVLWAGQAHRRAGDYWIHDAGRANPETAAYAAYRDLELAAAAAPPAADAHP